MKKLLIALLPAALLVASLAAQQERAPQNDSIRRSDLEADLYFVAGDSMQGRLTNTEGNRAAADFIKSRFERLGLTPAGPNHSYFQPFNLMTATLGHANALDIESDAGTRHLDEGQEFYPHRYSASGHAAAPVVFAGYGIRAPGLQWDDYGAGTVRGRIVLVLDHEPGEKDPNSPFDGLITSEWSTPWRKAVAAQALGAAGVLFVADVQNHPGPSNFDASARGYWPAEPRRIPSYTLESWADRVRIPVAQISPALAESLVAGTGKSLEDLAKASDAHASAPLALPGVKIDLRTDVARHIVPDHNVVALIEGSDPQLKDQWVIVSAHFDHNGADGSEVFNGADDNGSGTVALLEIAEAYSLAAKDGHRPKRSVLFAAWNSEERGLLGSWAYTEHPLAPLTSIAAVLNMDMIGRNEEIPVGGGRRFLGLEPQTAESNDNAVNVGGLKWAEDLRAPIVAADKGIGLELKPRYDNNASNLVRRSDQWPFLQHGVPAVGFFTGLHPDYHTPYDRPEKINYVKLEKIARLVHQASWDLANAPARPKSATNAAVPQ
ncbi:MAG: M28 family peptidase [Betaproteobacteria bacterium]